MIYPAKELFISLADVHEPIDHSNHDGASDNISNSDWQQIGNKEIAPGQVREVCGGLADHFEKFWIAKILDEQSQRDVVHIGNAMFKASGNETGYRQGVTAMILSVVLRAL